MENYVGNLNMKLTECYVLSLLVLLLFCPGWNAGYTNLTTTKFWVYTMLTCFYAFVMFCVFIAKYFRSGITHTSDKGTAVSGDWKRISRLFLALTWGFVAFSWISALTCDFGFAACVGIGKNTGLASITLYAISLSLILLYGKVTRRIAVTAVICLALYEGICVLQLLGFNPLWLYPAGLNYYDHGTEYSGVFLGTLGNLNLTGAFLSLCLPMLLCFLMRNGGVEQKGKLRMLPVVLMIVIGVGILVLTDSRAALVGVALGCIVAVPIMLNWGTRRVIIWILAAVIILTLCVGAWFFANGTPDDTVGSGRIYIWKNVLEVCDDHLLLGNGPGTLGLLFNGPAAQEIQNGSTYIGFERYDGDSNTLHIGTISDSHCLPLNILVNEGLVSLIIFLSATTILLWHCAKNCKIQIISILGTGLICFMIQSLFCISSVIVLPFAFIAAALILTESKSTSIHI